MFKVAFWTKVSGWRGTWNIHEHPQKTLQLRHDMEHGWTSLDGSRVMDIAGEHRLKPMTVVVGQLLFFQEHPLRGQAFLMSSVKLWIAMVCLIRVIWIGTVLLHMSYTDTVLPCERFNFLEDLDPDLPSFVQTPSLHTAWQRVKWHALSEKAACAGIPVHVGAWLGLIIEKSMQ